MAKNRKGMICLMQDWEIESLLAGNPRDCRNHRHLSRRRVFERRNDYRFADRILVHVYDARNDLLGLIVEVAGQARWALDYGLNGTKLPPRLTPQCKGHINDHVRDVQGMLDKKKPIPRVLKLDWTVPLLPSGVAICEAIRSYSPTSLTAWDAEARLLSLRQKSKPRGESDVT